MTSNNNDKMAIRQQMRKIRSALPAGQQHLASLALKDKVLEHISTIDDADRIAFYLSQDGEIDLGPLMIHCYELGRQCFLPVLDNNRKNTLKFAKWAPDLAMSKNIYGIYEPAAARQQLLNATDMELIFMPLVAFDSSGHRLGMGGGYYDRSLAISANKTPVPTRPFLVAAAHDIQCVAQLPQHSWDIVPDVTITPDRVIIARLQAER